MNNEQSNPLSYASSSATSAAPHKRNGLHTAGDRRKSKRSQRAKPEELAILESVFACTPIPSAETRKELAAKLNRTESYIKIWFQNHRAQLKNALKRQSQQALSNSQVDPAGWTMFGHSGSLSNNTPVRLATVKPNSNGGSSSLRPIFPNPSFDNGSKSNSSCSAGSASTAPVTLLPKPPTSATVPSLADPSSLWAGNDGADTGSSTPQSTLPSTPREPVPSDLESLSAQVLHIGSFSHTTTEQNPLLCRCDFKNELFEWIILKKNAAKGYKMNIPFTIIQGIELSLHRNFASLPASVAAMQGELRFHLSQQPTFYKFDLNSKHRSFWIQCEDFTPSHQATLHTQHSLHGDYGQFSQELGGLLLHCPALYSRTAVSLNPVNPLNSRSSETAMSLHPVISPSTTNSLSTSFSPITGQQSVDMTPSALSTMSSTPSSSFLDNDSLSATTLQNFLFSPTDTSFQNSSSSPDESGNLFSPSILHTPQIPFLEEPPLPAGSSLPNDPEADNALWGSLVIGQTNATTTDHSAQPLPIASQPSSLSSSYQQQPALPELSGSNPGPSSLVIPPSTVLSSTNTTPYATPAIMPQEIEDLDISDLANILMDTLGPNSGLACTLGRSSSTSPSSSTPPAPVSPKSCPFFNPNNGCCTIFSVTCAPAATST
ncbi:hypothetical protein IWQ62_001822 [Dispira parvispora]|uniref:Homeobox domain-containing protein n=1 Tax=Dispira parvispora TaxID=1520584 RepID=A0A9W8ARF9_9FUNG|nr:hypothetical protein IWQ62_001822 [Dispira parvispora]